MSPHVAARQAAVQTPAAPATAPAGETAADHLQEAMALLLQAERDRAVMTVENGEETIRLGLALLPDLAFRQIGTRLLAAADALEARG